MTDIHALSGAYAVDALDDLERARFERHLADCTDCTAEVAGYREAAAMLALTAETAPSDGVRASVLQQIRTVRPLPPAKPAQEVVRRSARRFPQLVAAAVAAAVVATGVTITAWHPWETTGTSETPPVALTERVIDANDAKMQSTAVTGGGRALVYHSRSVDRAVLVTDGLSSLPSSKAYELWFQTKNGSFVPAGLFVKGGDQTVLLRGKLGTAKGIGLTVEPASGSKQPTSAPIALFDLEKSV